LSCHHRSHLVRRAKRCATSAVAAIILLSVTRMFTPKLHAEKPPARARPHKTHLLRARLRMRAANAYAYWRGKINRSLRPRTDIRRSSALLLSEQETSLSLCFTCVCQSSILKVVRDPHESGAQRESKREREELISHPLSLADSLADVG